MITDYGILIRLVMAAFFGGLVGIERELRHKTAGFRTNILICLGSAVITIVSINLSESGLGTASDPGRIAAQVITGVGFLGAGAIIQSRGSVVGLTTAASIWTTAGIGLAFGAGYFLAGISTALLTLMILHLHFLYTLPFRKKWKMVHYIITYRKDSPLNSVIRDFYDSSMHPAEDIEFDVVGENAVVRFRANHTEDRHTAFQQRLKTGDKNVECVSL